MKIYRLHKYHPFEGPQGYAYYALREEAREGRKKWLDHLQETDAMEDDAKTFSVIKEMNIPVRKRALLIEWLNKYASCPEDS